jgi:hypothetical protein
MAVRLSAPRAVRPLPQGRSLILISVRGCVDPRAIVRLEGLGQLKYVDQKWIPKAKFTLIRMKSPSDLIGISYKFLTSLRIRKFHMGDISKLYRLDDWFLQICYIGRFRVVPVPVESFNLKNPGFILAYPMTFFTSFFGQFGGHAVA